MNLIKNLLSNNEPENKSSSPDISDIIGALREAILIVDENLKVVSANDAAVTIFAKQKKSLEHKRLSEVVRDISVHEAFRQALKENISSHVKIEISRKKKTLTFDVSVTRLDLDESKRAIGVFYDISQVEHLENVRQLFLSNISHELRTPLTSILAFVETLENGGIEDEKNNRRFLKIIRKNAQRMQYLIEDVSELSSIEAGNVKIELTKIKISELVTEVFSSLSQKAAERKIVLENHISDEAEILADRFRLEQMLTNLIDNAIKFNCDNGIVTVNLKTKNKYNYIKVSDTGEGILPAHKARIFERLYRADRSRSRDVGGTGLGLAIVKHLARLHNGTVKVKSTIGKGSTFTIRLPIEM